MNRKTMVKMWVAAVVAVATALPVAADVTINVKASSAPYLYAWDANQSPLNGAWPGTQMTSTKVHDGITYYTATIADESTVNLLFNMGDNTTQSGDFTDLSGEVYFEYDGAGNAWGTMPNNVIYYGNNGFIYYVDLYGWGQAHAYAYNGSGDVDDGWPGQSMTLVGQDGAGYPVYLALWNGTPTTVIITKNGEGSGSVDRHEVAYSKGAYLIHMKNGASGVWSTQTVRTIDNSRLAITTSNFGDTNFRAALGEALGITLDSNNENASQAFTASDVEVLDVTGKSISSLSGIAHFTNLKELYAGENSITSTDAIDLTALTHLEVLDVHANPSLQGFTTGSTPKCIKLASGTPLKYLDYSDCDVRYGAAITTWGLTGIETLKLANNSSLGWTGMVGNQTALKYLDYSNCGLASGTYSSNNTNAPNFTASRLTNLVYLDLSNNSITTLATLVGGLSSLKTMKVNNNTGLEFVSALSGAANLEHLEYANIGLTRLTDVEASHCPKLTYLDISGNAKNNSNVNLTFTGNNLETLIAKNMGTSSSGFTKLDFSNNKLSHVEIDGSYMTELDLSGNAFTQIPAFEGAAGRLNILTMNNSGLTSLAGFDAVSNPNIARLNVRGNALTTVSFGGTLPAGFNKLDVGDNTSLTSLDVSSRTSNSDFNGLYVDGCTSLATLDASGNTGLTSFSVPSGLTALTTLDMSGTGLSQVGTIGNAPNLVSLDLHDCPALILNNNNQLQTLKGTVHTKLASLNVSNCDLVTPGAVSGFPSLATLDISDNPKVTTFTASGNALTSIDISGCEKLATLDVSDNKFSNINFLNAQGCAVTDLDISRNNISSLSGISNASLVTLRINGSGNGSGLTSLAGVENFSKLKTLYANSNAFSGALSLSGTQLEQIDLSYNTGITSLDAKNNSLKSMLLQGCTGLTTLDVSGNKFVTTGTGSTLTTGMLNISNLALTELNLSNNEFTTIGANSSLAGMANTLTKLEARNNKFTDFRNGKAFPQVKNYSYTDEDGHSYTVTRALKAAQTSYNHISDLAALEWLDLSGNQKLDSVCVFFNPALKHLDLSDCHDPEQYGLETRSIRDKDSSNQLKLMLYKHTDNVHGGLYSLNLMANKQLEWLDISRTAIHETALTAISCEASYSSRGGYVYIHETPNLETFICNDNGMNSLGLAANTKLKHVEAQRMNGQSYIMRDNGANYGNINLHANVNGNSNSIEYFDVSNSGFSEVGVASACQTAAIKTLIVDGNPLGGLSASNTAGINLRNGDALTDCRTPDLETLSAKNCGDLTEVNVNYCQKLTDVDLSGSLKVKSLKMMNCVGLTEVPSLDKPEILETLMCGYNTSLSDLDVTGYPALKTLNCQNNAIEELDLSLNPALVDLYASTNSIDELEIPSTAIMNVAVDNNGMFKLDIGTAPNLMNLDFSNNHICAIDLSGAGNMIVDVNAEGNSRTIKANSVTYVQDKGGEPVTLYFFQLDNSADAQTYNTLSILDATCLEAGWAAHSMADDGFVIANATFSGTVAGNRRNRVASTADPSKLVADNIYGTIVPLGDSEDAVGYTYATGNSTVPTVSLGVNWESTSTPTAVVDLSADALSVRCTQGAILVQSPEATQLAVYDVSGRLVVVADVDAGESRIALEPGVYVVAGVKVAVR